MTANQVATALQEALRDHSTTKDKPVIYFSGSVEIFRTRTGSYRAQIETIHSHPAHDGEDLHDADTSRIVSIHFNEEGAPILIHTKNSVYIPKDKDNG